MFITKRNETKKKPILFDDDQNKTVFLFFDKIIFLFVCLLLVNLLIFIIINKSLFCFFFEFCHFRGISQIKQTNKYLTYEGHWPLDFFGCCLINVISRCLRYQFRFFFSWIFSFQILWPKKKNIILIRERIISWIQSNYFSFFLQNDLDSRQTNMDFFSQKI